MGVGVCPSPILFLPSLSLFWQTYLDVVRWFYFKGVDEILLANGGFVKAIPSLLHSPVHRLPFRRRRLSYLPPHIWGSERRMRTDEWRRATLCDVAFAFAGARCAQEPLTECGDTFSTCRDIRHVKNVPLHSVSATKGTLRHAVAAVASRSRPERQYRCRAE
jgi:hypothetical protein